MFRMLMIGAVSALTHGSDEQMFGPNEQVLGWGQSDQGTCRSTTNTRS